MAPGVNSFWPGEHSERCFEPTKTAGCLSSIPDRRPRSLGFIRSRAPSGCAPSGMGMKSWRDSAGRPMLARLDYRAGLIENGAGRGWLQRRPGLPRWPDGAGCCRRMACGTYLVDEAMVEELRLARRGEHASNLGALLALRFAQAAGVNAYIVDPVTVDEWQHCARLSGSPLVEAHRHRPCAEHQGRGAAVCAGTGARL